MGRFLEIVVGGIRSWLAKLTPKRIWQKRKSEKGQSLVREKTEMLSSHLRCFCKMRGMKLRENERFKEWKVKPAEFIEAYSLLVAICRTENLGKLQYCQYANYISYIANEDDNISICLTDKTYRKGITAVMQILYKKQCVLKIYFQTDKKKKYADNKT